MVPREDPKKFLLPGTLETLDEEAEDDVFSELLKMNVNGVNMGDLLLDKQHKGQGGAKYSHGGTGKGSPAHER